MNPLYITLLLLLFSMPAAVAQKLSIKATWGKEFKAAKSSTMIDVVGYDNTGFYALTRKFSAFNSYTLEHFDQEMNLTKSVKLELLRQGVSYEAYEKIIQVNNELFLFTSLIDNRSKSSTLYVKQIDKSALVPEKTGEKLMSMEYRGPRRAGEGDFIVKLSRDSTNVLVVNMLPYKAGDPEKFGFHVYDASMKLQWQQDVILPHKDDMFEIKSFKVSNTGNVYLLGKLYNKGHREKRNGEANYSYRIFSYSPDNREGKEYSIALEDRFLRDMQLAVEDDGDLICAGFYSERGTMSIRGTYFLTVDAASSEIKTKSFKEFSIDFITQYMKDGKAEQMKRKEERGGDVELYDYDLSDIILRTDGGAVLVAEQFYAKTYTYTTPIGGQSQLQQQASTYYYYNDIIAVNIGADGVIEWAAKIPKHQVSSDVGFYSSYALAVVRDKMYFVFNDDPENAGYDGSEKLKSFSGRDPVVMVVQLDSKGEVTRQPIFTSFGMDAITRPKVCEQVSHTEMVLFGQRKKTQQFAKVTFE